MDLDDFITLLKNQGAKIEVEKLGDRSVTYYTGNFLVKLYGGSRINSDRIFAEREKHEDLNIRVGKCGSDLLSGQCGWISTESNVVEIVLVSKERGE